MIKNLNTMIFGFVILVVIICIIVIGRVVMRRMGVKNKKKVKKMTSDLKIKVFHGVHTTVNTGAIPL